MTEDEPSFTCPCCGRTSYNLNDVAHAFCGYCRWFTEDGLPCPYHTPRLVTPVPARVREERRQALIPIWRYLCFAVVLNFVLIVVVVWEGRWWAIPGNIVAAGLALGVLVWSVRRTHR